MSGFIPFSFINVSFKWSKVSKMQVHTRFLFTSCSGVGHPQDIIFQDFKIYLI